MYPTSWWPFTNFLNSFLFLYKESKYFKNTNKYFGKCIVPTSCWVQQKRLRNKAEIDNRKLIWEFSSFHIMRKPEWCNHLLYLSVISLSGQRLLAYVTFTYMETILQLSYSHSASGHRSVSFHYYWNQNFNDSELFCTTSKFCHHITCPPLPV